MGNTSRLTDLTVDFTSQEGTVHAVILVTFEVAPGELVGLVGESGCGKSVTASAIIGLTGMVPNATVSGSIEFIGRDLLTMAESDVRAIRGRDISIVFQDPVTSLNPVLNIERLMTEGLELHLGLSHADAVKRSIKLLGEVGIPAASSRLDDYPHQFSGGMRQRVMIAMALSCNPKLLLADEPTTALDVTIQAQILQIMARLSRELGTAVVIITHNLGVVARYANRVNVMYAGKIVETASASELYANPRHPYTIGLLKSVPRLDQGKKDRLIPIEGVPPDLVHRPAGCSFAPRCAYKIDRCLTEIPPLAAAGDKHQAACWVMPTIATPIPAKVGAAASESGAN